MHPVSFACEPRCQAVIGELREDKFAARLKDVIDSTAEPVNPDDALFCDNTYQLVG